MGKEGAVGRWEASPKEGGEGVGRSSEGREGETAACNSLQEESALKAPAPIRYAHRPALVDCRRPKAIMRLLTEGMVTRGLGVGDDRPGTQQAQQPQQAIADTQSKRLKYRSQTARCKARIEGMCLWLLRLPCSRHLPYFVLLQGAMWDATGTCT